MAEEAPFKSVPASFKVTGSRFLCACWFYENEYFNRMQRIKEPGEYQFTNLQNGIPA
jgi:hypothetical protein